MAKVLWWCTGCHASGIANLHGLETLDAVFYLRVDHDSHEVAEAKRCTFSAALVKVEELREVKS